MMLFYLIARILNSTYPLAREHIRGIMLFLADITLNIFNSHRFYLRSGCTDKMVGSQGTI